MLQCSVQEHCWVLSTFQACRMSSSFVLSAAADPAVCQSKEMRLSLDELSGSGSVQEPST